MAVALLVSLSVQRTHHVSLIGLPQMRYVSELVGELPKHTWLVPADRLLKVFRELWIDKAAVERQLREEAEREARLAASAAARGSAPEQPTAEPRPSSSTSAS